MIPKATEKTKNKAMPPRNAGCIAILKWIGIAIGIIAFVIFAYFAVLFMWLNQGQVRSSLPEELIPTAEYLLENPQVEPPLDDSEFYVDVTEVDRNLEQICFVIASGVPGHYIFFDNGDFVIQVAYVEIFINDNLAGRAYTGGIEPYRTMGGYTTACINGIMLDGLHIIELHALNGSFGDSKYVKKWAVQIDCQYRGCIANPSPSVADFQRVSHVWSVYSHSDDYITKLEYLIENPQTFQDVSINTIDISVPTSKVTSICFDLHKRTNFRGDVSINNSQPRPINEFMLEGRQVCLDYRMPSGTYLVELNLNDSDTVYQWAIEIE